MVASWLRSSLLSTTCCVDAMFSLVAWLRRHAPLLLFFIPLVAGRANSLCEFFSNVLISIVLMHLFISHVIGHLLLRTWCPPYWTIRCHVFSTEFLCMVQYLCGQRGTSPSQFIDSFNILLPLSNPMSMSLPTSFWTSMGCTPSISPSIFVPYFTGPCARYPLITSSVQIQFPSLPLWV